MTAHCIGTPISWWRLERYQLGELAAADRDEIATHVAACEACSGCLARIDAAAALPLPPLRVTTLTARKRWRAIAVPATAGLALAAAVVLAIGRAPHDGDWQQPARTDRLEIANQGISRPKGGDVDFVLVGDDDELVAEAGGTYRDGQSFKVLVTCPPSLEARWDVVVVEHGAGEFPLPAAHDLACGNLAPLPGAFRLTGREPVDVCVVWSEDAPVDRPSLAFDRPPAEWAKPAVCKHLEPSR